MKTLPTIVFALLLLTLIACGGGGHLSSDPTGALNGNWQFTLVQNFPRPPVTLPVSGFLAEANEALTGSLQLPVLGPKSNCAGVSSVTGTVSGSNVTLSVDDGGTVLNLTGTISSDGTSMSGDYQADGGACFTAPTSGTWSGERIPALNGSFTGTLTNSGYMSMLTGINPPPPIAITGTITQSANFGASNATLTGTITADAYPCFTTASLAGTVSGQNVTLAVFGYNGLQIGVLTGSTSLPTASSGLGISGSMALGKATATTVVGPCPPLSNGGTSTIRDSTAVTVTFQ